VVAGEGAGEQGADEQFHGGVEVGVGPDPAALLGVGQQLAAVAGARFDDSGPVQGHRVRVVAEQGGDDAEADLAEIGVDGAQVGDQVCAQVSGRLGEFALGAGDGGGGQVSAVAEATVQTGLSHPGASRDIIHGQAGVAALTQQFERGGHDRGVGAGGAGSASHQAAASPARALRRSPQKTGRPVIRSSAASSRPLRFRPRRSTRRPTRLPFSAGVIW